MLPDCLIAMIKWEQHQKYGGYTFKNPSGGRAYNFSLKQDILLVGAEGFEPPTLCL